MLKMTESTTKRGYSMVNGEEVANFEGYIDSQYPDNMRVSMNPQNMALYMANMVTVMNDFSEFNNIMMAKYQEYKGMNQPDSKEVTE